MRKEAINQSSFFHALKYICIHFHPTSGDAYYYWVDFHFVSDEGIVVEAELNMPRGLEWNQCLIFRGKQTHTGSRHACHISLSSPVIPEGSGQGQPLCSDDATRIYIVQAQKYMTRHTGYGHKCSSMCWVCCWCCTNHLSYSKILLLIFSVPWDHQFDLPSWKAADLVHKPGSIFNFPRLISDCAGAEQLYSFTSARRRFSGFQ